jgi:hypothetical protein
MLGSKREKDKRFVHLINMGNVSFGIFETHDHSRNKI